MMRRPGMRDGVILPRFTLAAAALVAVGVGMVVYGQPGAWWVLTGGALAFATAVLVLWRLLHGAAIAAPVWVLFGAAVVDATIPAAPSGWITAAGVLGVASLIVVGSSGGSGVAVAAGLWVTFTGLVLRALPATWPGHDRWLVVLLAGAAWCVATGVWLVRARSSSQGLLKRLGRAGRRTDGMASVWDLWTTSSARRLRKRAAVLRPSTATLTRRQRRKLAATQFGTRLAKVGVLGVWSPLEDATLRVGGPRTGKTGEMCGRVLDAPGAVIATSTRLDILARTRRLRERVGPLYVFNPSGLGHGVDSTITFDPLQGCTDPGVVAERAADLIAGIGSRGNGGDGERWDTMARQALTAVMHAAALGGHSMHRVQRWIADPSAKSKDAVLFELQNAGAHAFVQMAKQFFDNNPNTQSSISTTIMPALAWLTIPTAAAAAEPGGRFDVAKLLAEKGTVYLLGAENAQTAPLVTALTAHIAREARAIAARQPDGRLDPQLTLVLDEAALICLIPLDRWTADMGGANITIHISAQSRAQLRQRFGEHAAGAMISNCATVMVFGGTKDDADLTAWSTLTGDRQEDVDTRDRDSGSRSVTNRRVPVMTPAQIAQLKTGQVLIISRAMPVSIGRAQMVWNRPDVRRLNRRDKRTATALRLLAGLTGARDWATPRLSSVLDWLDHHNPARGLVARLRLTIATRKAHAALRRRAATRRPVELPPVPDNTDMAHRPIEGGQR